MSLIREPNPLCPLVHPHLRTVEYYLRKLQHRLERERPGAVSPNERPGSPARKGRPEFSRCPRRLQCPERLLSNRPDLTDRLGYRSGVRVKKIITPPVVVCRFFVILVNVLVVVVFFAAAAFFAAVFVERCRVAAGWAGAVVSAASVVGSLSSM